MIAEVPVKGYFEENCFFYIDDRTKHGFIIDPGAQAGRLLDLIRKKGWTIEKILLTHGHFDHTGAVDEIRGALGIPVYAHLRSDEYLLDARKNLSALCGPPIIVRDVEYMNDGDVVSLDADPDFALKVIYVPGHTTDSVLFYSEADHVAFVGDTILRAVSGIISTREVTQMICKEVSFVRYLRSLTKPYFAPDILSRQQWELRNEDIGIELEK